MSLSGFLELFGTEQQCNDFLVEKRWGNKDKAVCPHCDCKKVYVRNHRMQFRCSGCEKNFSVKVGTVFEGSNIKLHRWFLAIYFISTAKKGMSSVELSEKIGCTQKTAWFMAHRIREACIDFGILKGSVEMDETFIGGKEKNKHASKKQGYHGTEGKTAVMGAISREDKQVVAYPVKEVSYSSVEVFREHNIAEGSTLYSDDCKAYTGQSLYKVNHGAKEYVRDGHIHTNTIESFWAILKRGYVGIYHHWSIKHLKRYIKEYTYRFNNKGKGIIESIIGNTIGKRLSYKRLVGKV